MSEHDTRSDLEVLTQYPLPLPLDKKGCSDFVEYLVQQTGGEAHYRGEFSGRLGNRFVNPDEPFRREERTDSFHVTLYFPLDVSSELVQIEFYNQDSNHDSTFHNLKFDLGLVDRLDEVPQKRQEIVQRVRGTLDTYFRYLLEREE
ncbi:MAG: hypothetical protein AABY00_02305 [Nanoarchaeota archaeon]